MNLEIFVKEIYDRYERMIEEYREDLCRIGWISTNSGRQELDKFQSHVKMCASYTILMEVAEVIISPYTDDYRGVVDKFWLLFFTEHAGNDLPDIKDFFEWYCDTETIAEEIRIPGER